MGDCAVGLAYGHLQCPFVIRGHVAGFVDVVAIFEAESGFELRLAFADIGRHPRKPPMRVLNYPAFDQLEIRDQAVALPKPDEVRLKVAACGVCGWWPPSLCACGT